MSSPSVCQVVWPWREKMGTPPPRKPNRVAAGIQAAVLLALAALFYFVFGHPIPAIVLCCATAAILIGSFFVPPLFFAIERMGKTVGIWVGTALTWGLLTPFYYLCFLPGNLILRLLRRDPLCRRFPSDEPTYWKPRKIVTDMAHYSRQY